MLTVSKNSVHYVITSAPVSSPSVSLTLLKLFSLTFNASYVLLTYSVLTFTLDFMLTAVGCFCLTGCLQGRPEINAEIVVLSSEFLQVLLSYIIDFFIFIIIICTANCFALMQHNVI